MLILHHLVFSRSTRIIWLLEELGLPYELKTYERDKKTMLAPKELKDLPPLGGAPILQDGDLYIGESAVIIEYILDTYGQDRLRPPLGTLERLNYNYWLHCSESSLAPLNTISLLLSVAEQQSPWFVRAVVRGVKDALEKAFVFPRRSAILDLVEETLSKNSWFVGDQFTGADIQMACGFIMSDTQSLKDKDRPFLKAYVKKVEQMPSYVRAIEKGGLLRFKDFLARL